ncbi:MAG TPA: hypothetical protein ENJ55_07435 [Rhizobiales bacterium]|nr:hypothetical protein [Hyphomicrobiales bacterium]
MPNMSVRCFCHRSTSLSGPMEPLPRFFRQMPEPIIAGDTFIITAGCNKSFETCKAKFSNPENFQGFPHMPGNDFVAFYPNASDGNNDGSPIS